MEILETVRSTLSGFISKEQGLTVYNVGPHKMTDVQYQQLRSMLMVLPVLTTSDVQVMDPDDPNFGEFKYMAGYDPIGEAPLG